MIQQQRILVIHSKPSPVRSGSGKRAERAFYPGGRAFPKLRRQSVPASAAQGREIFCPVIGGRRALCDTDSGSTTSWWSPEDLSLGIIGCPPLAKRVADSRVADSTANHHQNTSAYCGKAGPFRSSCPMFWGCAPAVGAQPLPSQTLCGK